MGYEAGLGHVSVIFCFITEIEWENASILVTRTRVSVSCSHGHGARDQEAGWQSDWCPDYSRDIHHSDVYVFVD